MKDYWDGVWSNLDINECKGYIEGYVAWKPKFIEIFQQHGVKIVCDAACGFGAYSVMLAKNGFNVSGFDISDESVRLTQKMMAEFGCNHGEFKACSITKIEFNNNSFCAVVAHAVIDHISLSDARIAMAELYRILSPGGLLFLSFDPLGDDDIDKEHDILDDGSRQYKDGLLFRHYVSDEIDALLSGKNILYSNINSRGEREYVLQK